MKKYFCFLLFYISFYGFAQKVDLKTTLKVTYNVSLQLGEKFRRDQQFVLIGNSQDYYFSGYHNYLSDTNQQVNSVKKSGISLSIADYLKERIVRKNGVTNVFGKYIDDKLKYEEDLDIKWVLYSETKIINGIKCQMAATNKFGRRWIAYFSKDYPQPLGPYKFTGLPGLIFELYDTRDDYHFIAIKVEKESNEYEFNLNGYKKLSKKDFLKATYNLQFTLAAYPPIDDESFRKETQNMLDKLKKMHNNPLELKPFE
ncbi:GLPGLI family protein [Chryseobacterium ginsenosidimutans]|uniref:GLPGLI family protein n=1 Tax=Chryseobacterium ginsenosidimutans TaxID=687846 RepID=UPI002787C001|nr:GLPGLI family protein [Chryseobacterium ginsenosidimutans]MDQ0592205.1 GLPGLI family protein [Chryseobacterium ginsenosidimutans]